MEVIEGTLTHPRFPEGKLDAVYLTNTYRHLEKPVEVLANIASSLKPHGRLGIIEIKRYNRDEDSNAIIRNARLAGFKLVKLETSLSRDDIYVFQLE